MGLSCGSPSVEVGSSTRFVDVPNLEEAQNRASDDTPKRKSIRRTHSERSTRQPSSTERMWWEVFS